ncbi:MAG: ABC transporter substrate-binding protein [Acidimicrobiia bacterium]|nr:ABC transporter substrate-binding protein [Acidimicrobiia bacterium]
MRHRFLRVWVIALVVVLVGAACGDDDDGGGGDAGGPTTEATAAEGDTTTTAGQAATGTPLTFGALCQESPPVVEVECYTTTQAVFDWYNAQGGLDGHPLELEHCDISASNPENMANCLQKLTGDSSVLAFVGNQGDEGIAALAEPAEMANIGPNILGLDAGTAPISFPLSPWGMGASRRRPATRWTRAPRSPPPSTPTSRPASRRWVASSWRTRGRGSR